jgi:hypothetical protein
VRQRTKATSLNQYTAPCTLAVGSHATGRDQKQQFLRMELFARSNCREIYLPNDRDFQPKGRKPPDSFCHMLDCRVIDA